jgi:hypothetical protein
MRIQLGRLLIRIGRLIGGTEATDVTRPRLDLAPEDTALMNSNAALSDTPLSVSSSPSPQPDGNRLPALSIEPTPDAQQQVRQLIKQALETPTIEQFTDFFDFSNRFRRLAVWNARMAYIQRPGAKAIASEAEWQSIGRDVLQDAVPIIILWPFSPIRYVYELADTGPLIERNKIGDPFATTGTFEPKVLKTLIAQLAKQKTFTVTIEYRRQGFLLAGSVARQGSLPGIASANMSVSEQSGIGEFSRKNAVTYYAVGDVPIPVYRVALNDRLTESERFVTLAHELGHIFCGHAGACLSGSGREDEETGWPDRRSLGKSEREIEAEAVAYIVAARAGLVTASAAYLRRYVKDVDMSNVNTDLIVRAATRIERLAKVHYGTMTFKKLEH